MKYYALMIFSVIVLVACTKTTEYSSEKISPSKQDALKKLMVRYYGKRPEAANEESKFDEKFNAYYDTKAKEASIMYYHSTDSVYYILVAQIAPSMLGKKHATGIRFKLTETGELMEYEEVFRTWKMLPDTLQSRGRILFDKMVKGEPLEEFQTKNSNGVEYIEFPDDLNHFDKSSRRWIFTPLKDTLIN